MIEVKSKFDAVITKPLLKFSFIRLWWFMLFFSLLFIFVGILAIVGVGNEPDLVFGIIMLAIGFLYPVMVYFFSKLLQKIINKSMKVMSDDTTNYFRFDENKIYQEVVKGDEYKTTTESSYSLLYKAYETQSHYFMYISNMQTHVLPKKDIVTGTSEELSKIFSDKLGKKFKVSKIK